MSVRFYRLVLRLTVALKALTAVYGAISAGLEGYLRGNATAVTNHFVHLTFATVGVLRSAAGGTACRAAAGLILESLISKKLLFAGREQEFLTTVPARQGFVFKHFGFLQIVILCPRLSSDSGVDFQTFGHSERRRKNRYLIPWLGHRRHYTTYIRLCIGIFLAFRGLFVHAEPFFLQSYATVLYLQVIYTTDRHFSNLRQFDIFESGYFADLF